jgi:hypothetical protein
MPKIPRLILRDIRFAYRPNFAGEKRRFNDEGDRNFTIRFDDQDEAMQLAQEGWNIKEKVNSETEEIFWTLEVAVSFKHFPPHITKIGELTLNEIDLNETTVELLDNIHLSTVDVELSPYFWDVNGKQGIKAYLHRMVAWVEESALDLELKEELRRRRGDVVAGDPIFGD